ncbi:ABC transporter permease [Burkholderia stabilis]|uniref:ABC transporter permease n=1 Tax=Burkholderia stabilis TaxID=95485 RepID=UPI000AC11090|nr:ABC transporter permease subunit [Burkholderia stabilis]HDR9490160.1 ABC transporter permease subunit [Burkholderia stabilis]HDR9521714.1 ABC transporter permease subunit [Burkholderia stabilis]HDR9537265.1 ABC transporter permease subunit [Burkholderia stabilis]HDR9575211.1 ABC transporter permease subunit [Burkholderia stabilis]HDR9583546.1 ABC transporter permease subunit [Burkholderia stabilis]
MTVRAWHASRVATLALGLVLPCALAVIWQLAVDIGVVDAGVWASPALVARAVATQAIDPQFHTDMLASLRRDALGTVLGILVGLPAGLALGRFRTAQALFSPTLDAAKSVPIFAFVPLLSVWVGSGEAGKVTFIALVAALPVVFNAAEGAASLAAGHDELARLYRLRPLDRLRRVLLPASLPGILRGVHLALLYGWLATIGAEFLFEAGSGLGTNIMGAREMYALDFVTADMLAIGLIGIVLDLGFARAEAYLLRWRGEQDS